MDLDAAVRRETELWEALRHRDVSALERLIAEDALDVGPAGILQRDGIIGAVLRMNIDAFAIGDAFLQALGDVHVFTYLSTVDGTHSGRSFASREVLNTSVWRRAEGVWRLVHRQETPVRQPRS